MSKTTEWIIEREQKGENIIIEPNEITEPPSEQDVKPLSLEEFEKQWSRL